MSNLAEGIAPNRPIAQGSADLPTPPLCQTVSGFRRSVGVGWRPANEGEERTRSRQPLTLTGRGKLPYSPLSTPRALTGLKAGQADQGTP